jgi:hypothetical protein
MSYALANAQEAEQRRGRLSIPVVSRLTATALAQSWPAITAITVVLAWLPDLAWNLVPWPRFLSVARPINRIELHLARSAVTLPPEWLACAAIACVVVARGAEGRRPLTACLRAAGVYMTLLPYWLIGASDTWSELAMAWFFSTKPRPWMRHHLFQATFLEEAALLIPMLLGLLLAMAVGVIVPTAVAERRSVAGSLRRSWTLLAGSRWRFLGLFVLIQVAPTLVGLASRPLIAITGAAQNMQGWAGPRPYIGWSFYLAQCFVSAVGWTAIAVAYLELRRLHDGPEPDELQEVFA